jgi:RNA 2',3'-cyclic 3'-phosphodiesterase
MRTLRAFLAVRPSDEVLAEIARAAAELAPVSAEVRWLAADGLHVTLKFLGDVPEAEVPGIERALEERFCETAPIDVELRGLGVFPNWKKPRIVWVGLHGDGLAGLVDAAERALSPLGFPPEGREFEPHLTIGRLRSMRGWEALSRALQAAREQSFGTTRLTEVTLYKSVLRPEGSLYTPLRRFALGPAEA